MITVYQPGTTNFTKNGDKILHPRKAVVRKEDNGDYYIDIEDTVDAVAHYVSGNLVRVDTPWGQQVFRMGNPKKTTTRVKIRAQHIYFDSLNYWIEDSYVVEKSTNDALDYLNSATDQPSPFSTLSDVDAVDSYRCVRTSLAGAIDVLLERWGGHLVRDNYDIEIREVIGHDRGVVLSYAKNIKDMTIDEDWSRVATKLMPVGANGLTIPEKWLTYQPEDYDIPYTKVVTFNQGDIKQEDYTNDDGTPDVEAFEAALLEDLYDQGEDYLQTNHVPSVNYTLSAYLKDVSDVGDLISVNHPRINIALQTNVIAIEYDPIADRFNKIEFGNFRTNDLGNLVQNVSQTAQTAAQESVNAAASTLQLQLEAATDKINSAMSDSYVIYDGDAILVVDELPKEAATNVIKINNGGIGFSNSGINGTFASAWTIDNKLNMENINVINLVADMIKGGTLKLGENLNQRGIIEIYGPDNSLTGEVDNTGITLYLKTGEYVRLAADEGLVGYDANDNRIYWADGQEFHQRKSVVEEEITIGSRLRIIPIDAGTNHGVGFVTLVDD